jgi:hypothetical protein
MPTHSLQPLYVATLLQHLVIKYTHAVTEVLKYSFVAVQFVFLLSSPYFATLPPPTFSVHLLSLSTCFLCPPASLYIETQGYFQKVSTIVIPSLPNDDDNAILTSYDHM